MRLKKNQERLILNGTYQFLFYTEDINLLGENKFNREKYRSPISCWLGGWSKLACIFRMNEVVFGENN
jgi:hypothetical protein